MSVIRRLRPLDYAAVFIGAALCVFVAVYAYSGSAAASHVHITGDEGEWLYSLDEDREIEIEGPIGTTRIEISGGGARVTESPCPEKICINSGILESGGEWTSCLPNRVFLRITGDEDQQIDSFSY